MNQFIIVDWAYNRIKPKLDFPDFETAPGQTPRTRESLD